MTDFYMNMQVNDFSFKGKPIRFSNPTCLPEYEKELKSRGLKYVVVKGLGDWGVQWAIISLEDLDKYKTILVGRIVRVREILDRHENGLRELGIPL